MKSAPGKVRIIGGQWRGRKLLVSDLPGLRPTPDRVKETLFNWLQAYIAGSRCLDLFAGTGALGFEAASRGAIQVILIENNKRLCDVLAQQIVQIAAENIEIIHSECLHWLSSATPQTFDIVFIDAPFQQNLIRPCIQALLDQAWVHSSSIIYVEAEAELVLDLPLKKLKHQRAGQVQYALFSTA